jgi:hypothetical protein
MYVCQQSVDVLANTSRNLTATARGDISSLIVRWSSRTGRITKMALVTLPAPGRDLDGRYKRLPARRLVQAFGTQQGLLLFVCRRLCNRGRRLGIQKRSLSGARAEGGRLRRHGRGSCTARGCHTVPHRAERTMVWPLYGFGGVSITLLHAREHDLMAIFDRCGEIRAGSHCAAL